MAIVNIKNNLRKKIKYVSNPVIEMAASLHVLSEPDHHVNCIDWSKRAIEKIGDGLLGEIRFIGDKYNQWSYIMDIVEISVHECSDGKDVECVLGYMENMSLEEFTLYFLGETYVKDVTRAVRWIENPDTILEDDIKDLTHNIDMDDLLYYFRNIDKVREIIGSIFRKYWTSFFWAEWERISSVHMKTVDKERLVLMESDPAEYILKFNKDFLLEEYTLIMVKNKAYQMRIDMVDNIYIVPSIFTAPHLMLNTHANNITIYMNVAIQNIDRISKALMDNIKAISDETRILILKALTREPRTTKELAEDFDFAPATISQHLKLLKNAGLVKNEKIKNYVYYSAEIESVEKILEGIQKYFME